MNPPHSPKCLVKPSEESHERANLLAIRRPIEVPSKRDKNGSTRNIFEKIWSYSSILC
jgi:hypothetical protein